MKDQACSKQWIIFAQKPMGGVHSVINYLGRYAHRVAITNSRISEIDLQKYPSAWQIKESY